MEAPCRECGKRRAPPLREVVATLALDDLDSAIDGGLLAWNGCAACASRQGLSLAEIGSLRAARDLRLRALAARERFRAREQRLQRRNEERAARQAGPGRDPGALPAAAAAALARAKAMAAQRGRS